MNQFQKDAALKRGVVASKIVRVLHEAMILHVGWEFDSKGWLVECEDGKIMGITTNHGSVCVWHQNHMELDLKRAQDSAKEITAVLQLLVETKTQTKGKK